MRYLFLKNLNLTAKIVLFLESNKQFKRNFSEFIIFNYDEFYVKIF